MPLFSSDSRFSGHKAQATDGVNDELCMGMSHEVTVEVKARYNMLPNEEEGKACKNRDDGELNEFDCYAQCRLEFIRKICDCTPPTTSYLLGDVKELKSYPLCDYGKCKIELV